MKLSKRLKDIKSKFDSLKDHDLSEALDFLKNNSSVKFNETVELAVALGVDPRKSDQAVRGSVSVPNGLGKTVRILVFAEGPKEQEAKDAGADYVGSKDLADKIKGGWLDFDVVVATPDMMRVLGPLGKVLGPRGLMPNPKVGTVTMDVAKAITELKAGKVAFRLDKAGIVHAGIGKLDFETKALVGNIKAVMEAINKAKPTTAKGTYIKKISVSSTMGAGLRVDKSFMLA